MPRTFKIVKGSDEVDLIDTGDTGIIFSRGGAGRNSIRPNLIFTSSSLTDGAALRAKNYPIVGETYILNLKGDTHDGTIATLQALERILLDADDHQLTNWQQSPVYLKQQTTGETNARNSLIIAWQSQRLQDLFNFPFEGDSDLDEIDIFIAREPFWRGTAPGVLSSLEPIKAPDFPYFDIETTSGTGALDITAAAAQNGDWGAAFTIAAAADTAFGTIKDPNNMTEFSIKFNFNQGTTVMSDGDLFSLVVVEGSGTNTITFVINYRQTAGVRLVRVAYGLDDGSTAATGNYAVASGEVEIKVEWKASTGPGNDDGELILSVGGDVKETVSSLDTDTYDVDLFKIGAVAGVDAGTSGDFYCDDILYDDASPFSAAFRTEDFEVTEQFVSNFRQSTALTHIFIEDNGTGFSANLLNEPIFTYFEFGGSTVAANDAIYFGADEPFWKVALNFKVAGSGTTLTLGLFYWSGAAFTSIPDGVRGAPFLDGYTGPTELSFNGASDWAKTVINGQNKFWLKLNVNGATAADPPEQGDQIVYLPQDTYYELNATQVHGDIHALSLHRIRNYADTRSDWSFIALGMKGRGLANFKSRLNFGNDEPGITALSATDSAKAADPTAVTGDNITCTFATNQTNIVRGTIVINDAAIENDFEGVYRIYLRAQQVNGSAGDVSVQLKVSRVALITGEIIPMKQVANDIELLDMGTFSLLDLGVRPGESEVALQLEFQLFASSANGTTPDLVLHDLALLPIDEMAFITSVKESSLFVGDPFGVQIDSGLQRIGSNNFKFFTTDDTLGPIARWASRGSLPEIEPRRQSRIYFIFGALNTTTNVIESPNGIGGSVQIYLHEQWIGPRGAD